MRRHPLLALTLIPLACWLGFILPDLLAAETGPWAWRRALILLSGILALWWMSAGMLLATRPAWLENVFGGLDKLYRLHKNFGIGAGVLILLHWQLEWLPKTLAKAGLIARPGGRGPKPPKDWLVDLAKDVGEWAGYILMALVVIALIRRIPYRYFRLVHKVFPLVFLAGAFHGLLLMPKDFWQTPLAWLTLAVAAVGVVPALLSLAGRIGRSRQHAAQIDSIETCPDRVLLVGLRPTAQWPGHTAGQFVFADFGHRGEGPHPFTIASAWSPDDGTLTLAIKALGDYTATLAQRLTVGQPVMLEGPYGRFDFAEDKAEHQVWIAGGIGVTPFLARLQALAEQPEHGRLVDFFYCLPRRHPGDVTDQLQALCAATGVRLHLRETDSDGQLDPAEVKAALQTSGSVWFCGPRTWGEALQRKLQASGLLPGQFHRELFEFR